MAPRLALDVTKPRAPDYAVVVVEPDLAPSHVMLLAADELVEHHWSVVVRAGVFGLPFAFCPASTRAVRSVWRVTGLDRVGGNGRSSFRTGPYLRLNCWRGLDHCVPVAADSSGAQDVDRREVEYNTFGELGNMEEFVCCHGWARARGKR